MDHDIRFLKHTLNRSLISTFVFEKFGSPLEMYDRFQHCLVTSGNVQTWKMMGTTTKNHYQSCALNMNRVKVTLLILHADDDPIVHGRQMNWNQLLNNKHIICMVSKSSEGVAREWSTVVSISMNPPSSKPVSLTLSRSPLSKTPKQVFFNPINIFDSFTHSITVL